MSTFLSVALLIVGTLSTAAAFGGKTWKEGPEPFSQTITRRGWLSLACLVMALGLGFWKLKDNSAEKDEVQQAAALSSANAEAQHTNELKAAGMVNDSLRGQPKDAQTKLDRLETLNEA